VATLGAQSVRPWPYAPVASPIAYTVGILGGIRRGVYAPRERGFCHQIAEVVSRSGDKKFCFEVSRVMRD
jgi:hypothetical protein